MKGNGRGFDLSAALHIHGFGAIHQDVGNGGIVQQGFERAKTQNLVFDAPRQQLTLR